MQNLLSKTLDFLTKLMLYTDFNDVHWIDDDDKKYLELCINRIKSIKEDEDSKSPLLNKMNNLIHDYYYNILKNDWDQFYAEPCNHYYPHKVLMYAPLLHYGNENQYLILAEVRCKDCDNYFLSIFSFEVTNENLYVEDNNFKYDCLSWCNFEFPSSTEGYLSALKTFNGLLSEATIDFWINEGKEPSWYKKPSFVKPSRVNFFGLLTKEIPSTYYYNNPDSLFYEWGSRSGNIQAPHRKFPEQKGDFN